MTKRSPDPTRGPAGTAQPRRYLFTALATGAALSASVIFSSVAGISLVAQADAGPPEASSEVPEQARVEFLQEERDLGAMEVSEERTAEFLLINTGGAPLQISRVRTSCMCTFAEVVINGSTSPEFNMEMHSTPAMKRWKGTVAPGATAHIRVIYKPSLMPVEGSVGRNVKFRTNDPNRPDVELGIRAFVLPD